MMDVITGEFKDLASCFLLNVNYAGTLAVLAGHKVYGLVQLNNSLSYSATKRLRQGNNSHNHQIQDIKFCKGNKPNIIAEASANKIILHDCIAELETKKRTEFYAHKRDITCIDWNEQTDLLASSSLDNLLHIWDTRKRRESPCIRINSSASAGKVAWEKTCGNILASTHENQLRVWDIRSRTDTPLGIYINRETDLGVRSFDDSDFCNARNRRILSIDFSPKRKNVIVTGSADSVVRVFEVNKSTTDAADVIFQVPQKRWPVVSVKQTPFGDGLVTLVWNKELGNIETHINSKYNIYHTRENNLALWTSYQNNRVPAGSLVHTFYGHNDLIMEQDWVVDRGSINKEECKLITWSKDNTLKLWPISDNIKEMCGHKESRQIYGTLEKNLEGDSIQNREISEEPSRSEYSVTRDTGYRSQSAVSSHSKDSSNDNMEELEDEVVDANGNSSESLMTTIHQSENARKFSPPVSQQAFVADLNAELLPFLHGEGFGDRVSVETSDLRSDPYTVLVADTTNHHAYLKVKYPKGYPLLGESPQFSFITGTSLDQATAFDIQRKMQVSAQNLVSKRQRCLETCFKLFEREMDAIFQKEKEAIATPGINIKIPKGNDAIPFPRTSGGRFCGLGQLVCFGWAYSVQISNVGKTSIDGSSTTNNVASRLARTPRALSALSDTSHLMTSQIQKIGNTPPYTSGKISASVLSTSSDGSSQQVSTLAAAQVMSNICRQTSRVSFDTKLSLMTRDKEMTMFNQYMQYQNRFSSGQELSSTSSSSIKSSDYGEPKKIVTVYDSLKLLPFDKNLAEEYQLCGPNLKNVCIYNAQIALRHGFKKIAECWRIVANCCKDSGKTLMSSMSGEEKITDTAISLNEFHMIAKRTRNIELFRSWSRHPDGEKLLNEVILKFANKDFQTAAMICSVFAKATNKNVHIDGGSFFSTFVDVNPKPDNNSFSRSMEAIVRRNKEIIHSESNPKAAAIAARQLRKAQRFKGLRNLSECQSESQDRRSITEYHKNSESIASDGDNQMIAASKSPGFGDRLASSVANTNLLNIPGILRNFASKSPTRKPSRSISMMGLNRSYSDANVAEDIDQLKHMDLDKNDSDDERDLNESKCEHPLLDPTKSHVYDEFRKLYAEMLHRSGLAERAVEILHLMDNPYSLDTDSLIMYKPPENYICSKCQIGDSHSANSGNACINCRRRASPKCAYCRLPVKGHVSVCLSCGHGGHLNHMMEWFQNNNQCAAICGCDCLTAMEQFDYISMRSEHITNY